jgi:hypothetical protein
VGNLQITCLYCTAQKKLADRAHLGIFLRKVVTPKVEWQRNLLTPQHAINWIENGKQLHKKERCYDNHQAD